MGPQDIREARIILQNALAHATAISIHNAAMDKTKIDAADVIELAKTIAREVIKVGKDK